MALLGAGHAQAVDYSCDPAGGIKTIGFQYFGFKDNCGPNSTATYAGAMLECVNGKIQAISGVTTVQGGVTHQDMLSQAQGQTYNHAVVESESTFTSAIFGFHKNWIGSISGGFYTDRAFPGWMTKGGDRSFVLREDHRIDGPYPAGPISFPVNAKPFPIGVISHGSPFSAPFVDGGLQPPNLVCSIDTPQDKNCGKDNNCSNPIHGVTGKKFQHEAGYRTADGRIAVDHVYFDGTWRFLVTGRRVAIPPNSTDYRILIREDGQRWYITKQTVGAQTSWVADPDLNLSASLDQAGVFTLQVNDQKELYDTQGRLIQLVWLDGYSQQFTWAADSVTATDSFGRTYKLSWATAGTYELSVQGTIQATYSFNNGALDKVTWADGSYRQYLYQAGRLTGITDENGKRYATWQYDANGKGLSSEHGEMGADKYTFNYRSDLVTDITGPLGLTNTYTYLDVLGVYRHSNIARGSNSTSIEYDAQGNLSSRTDFGGNKTLYSFNARNLETSRTEASGTPQARTIATVWHASFRLPIKVTETGRVTDLTYDANGNLTQKTITAGSTVRTWKWTYGSFGQVATATDPNGKLTKYAYDAQGNLTGITNPLNQVTQLTAFDAQGNPLTIKDYNGVETTLTYTVRGWLKSRKVSGETTSYEYDGVGQLTKVTFPDSHTISYSYDSAHRLTDISDSLGNSIHYTLDLMGNKIKEEIYDASGALAAALRSIDQTRQSLLPNPANAA